MLQRDHPPKTVGALQAKVLKWWFRCTGARLLLLEKLLRARLPLREAPEYRLVIVHHSEADDSEYTAWGHRTQEASRQGL